MVTPLSPPDAEAALSKQIATAQLVYLGIGGAIVSYGIIGYAMARANAPFTGFASIKPPLDTCLRYLFWGLGIGGGLPAILLVKRALIVTSRIGTDAGPGDLGALFLKQAILSAALAETPAMWGLILFLLTGSWFDLLGLSFVGLVYLALFFPTSGKAAELATELAARSRDDAAPAA